MYRRHFPHFILISFVIYLAVAIVTALLSWAAGTFGAFIGVIFSLFGMFLLQAALVKAVQDVRDGAADLDLKGTLSAAMPYVGKVAIAGILASIAIAIGFAIVIVPGLVLLTFWSLIIPWIVIGGASAFESFGRSWRTVKGYAWHVFGTFVLVFIILIVAQFVLSLILLALPVGWRSFISDVVSGTLIAPFLATVVTLIYYRLTGAHGEAAEPGMAPPGYGTPSGYGQPGGYGPPPSGYGPPPSGYGSPSGYGPPPSGYGQPGGYGHPEPSEPPAGSEPPTGYGPPPGGGHGQPPESVLGASGAPSRGARPRLCRDGRAHRGFPRRQRASSAMFNSLLSGSAGRCARPP